MRTALAVTGALILCAIAIGATAAATPLVRTSEPTLAGRNIVEWHQLAVRRRVDRDWLQHRLGIRVRELMVLQRRFKAEPTRPPHYNEWLCIHGGEGAWTSNTGNGYYGGLQFAQSTWTRNGGLKYASRADLATPLQQMWIAENAWRESGGSFSQWPNTARRCGLL